MICAFVTDLWLTKKTYNTEISFCAMEFIIRIQQGSESSSWNLFGVLVWVAFFW